MKNMKFGLLSVMVLTLLSACVNDNQTEQLGEVPISLNVVQITDAKAVTRASTSVQSTQFASGETFYVYFPSNVKVGSTTSGSATTFTTTNTSGATTPTTQPYINAGASSATIHAYYPYIGGGVINTTTAFSVELNQSTDANYKKSDLMYATATVQKSSPSATLSFTHKMAKILVTAIIGSGISNIQGVRIVGGYRTINIATPQSCTLGSTLSNALSTSSYITMWSGSSTSNVTCAALIPPQSINGSFLQIITDQGTATYSLASATSFASGTSYQRDITVRLADIGTTTAITGWTSSGSVGYVEESSPAGAKAVDLGLASGTKWANMNVGALEEAKSTTSFNGTYFAWGEIVGLNFNAHDNYKTNFSWSTYAWCLNGSSSKLTKYCPTSYQGTYWWNPSGGYESADNKTQLDLVDDAAHANWGGNWRMPTKDDWQELVATKSNTTDYTWTWYNGSSNKFNNTTVAGWKIASKKSGTSGNYIFIPMTGYMSGTSLTEDGYGYYWSSTLDTPVHPYFAYFGASSYSVESHYERCYGYSVRPVQD